MNRRVLKENSSITKPIAFETQEVANDRSQDIDIQSTNAKVQQDFSQYLLPKVNKIALQNSQKTPSKQDILRIRSQAILENKLNYLFRNISPLTERSQINEQNLLQSVQRSSSTDFSRQYFMRKAIKQNPQQCQQQLNGAKNYQVNHSLQKQGNRPVQNIAYPIIRNPQHSYIRSSLDQISMPLISKQKIIQTERNRINMEFFKYYPSAEERMKIQLKDIKTSDILAEKKKSHHNSNNQSQGLITERSVQNLNDNQNQYTHISTSQPSLQKLSQLEKNSPQQKYLHSIASLSDIQDYAKQSPPLLQKHFPSKNKLNNSSKKHSISSSTHSTGMEIKPSLLTQLGGEETIDKLIDNFKQLYETKGHLNLDYKILKGLLVMLYDRDKILKQISSTEIRMHFKDIGLGQFQYMNICDIMKQSFELLPLIPPRVIQKCLEKLETPQKFMVNFSLLEEIGGEEVIIQIVDLIGNYIEEKDEIMKEVLQGKKISLNHKVASYIIDFLKFILIDPRIYQKKQLKNYVQPLEFQYLDFFRFKFILEKQFRVMNWTEINIQQTLFRLEQFRFFILKTPPFYLHVLEQTHIYKEIVEELYGRLRRSNYVYHLYINNKVKLDAIQQFSHEIVKFLVYPHENKEFVSVLKQFRSQKYLMTLEFFNNFESQIIDILKFHDFNAYYLLEVKKKIEILLNIENIKTPFFKKLPPNAIAEIKALILELFDEQLQISQKIDKETLKQVVQMLLSDCMGELANDIMPIYLPIWDLQAIKVWFKLDILWLDTFKMGITKYFEQQQLLNDKFIKEILSYVSSFFKLVLSLN